MVVTTNGGATGTLKLTLWRDVSDPLTIGTPYTLAILYRNQAARLPFAGVAGDSLGVDLNNVTLPSGGTLQILQPNGSPLGLPVSGSATFTTVGDVINAQTLPATGTHTLVITPSSSGTGGATVRVFRR